MSEGCSHNCSECMSKGECSDFDFREKLNEFSSVKKVIGIVSGKGGVGKSLVTSSLAVLMNRKGYKTAILDADITGPSIPKSFGLTGQLKNSEEGTVPMKTKTGIEVVSINLLLDDPSDPVIWRGPIIAGTVKQFWSNVVWKDIDVMFVDMPPGTGDVPLTIFQSLPIDGILLVTSPQDLVNMIVEKTSKMAKTMNIPIVGMIENMSYYKCPDCGKEHSIFGESKIEKVAKEQDIKNIARIPIDPKFANACDNGMIEMFENDSLDEIANMIEKM